MFDLRDAAGVDAGGPGLPARASRALHPRQRVRFATRGFETVRLSFIVQRPANERGFRLRAHRRRRAATSATRCDTIMTDAPATASDCERA